MNGFINVDQLFQECYVLMSKGDLEMDESFLLALFIKKEHV